MATGTGAVRHVMLAPAEDPGTGYRDGLNANDEERLFNIGFQRLAWWTLDGGKLIYQLQADDTDARARLKIRAALYAFTSDRRILYIGKTALTLAQRLSGYCNPGATQSTNQHCHQSICEMLAAGKKVHILSLGGLTPLRWGEFELNIAAGLEDSLIVELIPPWNGGKRRPVTESEAIEREALGRLTDIATEDSIAAIGTTPASVAPSAPLKPAEDTAKFRIELGDTYYHQGIINPGSKIARRIGAHGETMLLRLGATDQDGIQTTINRRANPNGNPRLYGRRPVADWFQEHFKLGDTVTAAVIGPHEIVLELPEPVGDPDPTELPALTSHF